LRTKERERKSMWLQGKIAAEREFLKEPLGISREIIEKCFQGQQTDSGNWEPKKRDRRKSGRLIRGWGKKRRDLLALTTQERKTIKGKSRKGAAGWAIRPHSGGRKS